MHTKDHATEETPLPLTPAGRAAQKAKTYAEHVPDGDMTAEAPAAAPTDDEVKP